MTEYLEAVRCPEFRAYWQTPGVCDGCGKSLAGTRKRTWCGRNCAIRWEIQHYWNVARHHARRRAKHRCSVSGCLAMTGDVEINHIVPRAGRGYGISCAHHATNLEALCHRHHVALTREQRRAGLLSRPSAAVGS